MSMNKIIGKIKLLKKIKIEKEEFINNELKPFMSTQITCLNCLENIEINIIPFQTGFPFFQIYRNEYLSIDKIIEEGLAKKSSAWSSHHGEYLVYDLPTLYFKQVCHSCKEKFIIVFGLGESQPGKWICKISGVWQIAILHPRSRKFNEE